MSYVGEPYKYDLFFSYPHAVEALRGQTTMREWARKVADSILEILTLSLAGEDGGERLYYYLDRDRSMSGEPLTETLEQATQSSAVLVILMSPFYKSWSGKELDWFLEKARADGRGFGQIVLIEVQRTDDKGWPDELRDKASERLLRKSLMDKDTGLPLDFETFKSTSTLPSTNGLLTNIAIEIRDKLMAQRRLIEAQRKLAATMTPQESPERPLVYLDAEPEDHAIWNDRRRALADAQTIVLPDDWIATEQAGAVAPRSESAMSVYKDCDGLVLHRARVDDGIAPRIRRAYQDRRLLLQKEGKTMPWAVLDELSDVPLPSALTFRVPRVVIDDSGDWPTRLLRALGSVREDAAPPS